MNTKLDVPPPHLVAGAEVPPRGPLDPIVKPLWRLKRPARRAILAPFVGRRVRIDRWYGRVAALGDQQYEGELLAVAITTIGSASDLLILATSGGTVWAISTAQVAYLGLHEEVSPRKRSAKVTKAAAPATPTTPAKRVRRKAAAPEAVAA